MNYDVELGSKEGLPQRTETGCLEQEEGRIFVTAGVKCIVFLEAQPFQNMTPK